MKKKIIASNSYRLKPLGDSAIVVEFGESINLETNLKVKALTTYLDNHPLTGVVETIPAYTTVTIFYNPYKLYSIQEDFTHFSFSPYKHMSSIIEDIIIDVLTGLEKGLTYQHKKLEIPVCYGGEFGPDLLYVAEYHGLSAEEVISIHSEGEYLVYMLGFTPGFPYLGGISDRIATPRRSAPRMITPAGSVGIAGVQTGVYPMATPGGWQIIGRTPVTLFSPKADPPSLLQMGDILKFKPISPREFADWKGGD